MKFIFVKIYRIVLIGLIAALLVGPLAFADPLQEYFQQGQQAYDEGDYEKAAKLYEKVVEFDPNFAPVYNALGLTYRGLNSSLEDVTWLFKVATDIDPNYLEAYDNLCKIYYQAAQYGEAEKSCLKILSLNPSYGPAQLTLGWIYLGKSQPDKAVAYFEEILKRVQAPGIYLGLGTAYAMNGQHAEVLDMVTKLRSLGQPQMAAQLENMIRTRQSAPALAVPQIDLSERQVGTIVSSGETPVPSAVEPTEGPPRAPGFMKVRLKGKLSATVTAHAVGSPQPASSETSSSSSSAYTGGTENRSAIERIRALQKRRMGVIPQPGSRY